MSDDYTYEKPNEEDYFTTLMKFLSYKKEYDIIKVLKDGKCSIKSTGNFSHVRWNGVATTVYFYVKIENLGNVTEDITNRLIDICDEIMPKEIGFDVLHVEFSPLISNKISQRSLIDDIEEETSISFYENEILPESIKQKGKEMAEVYLCLYYVENSLRLFIEKIGIETFGENYFDELNINNDIKKNIRGRKQKETKNGWLGIRGDSDLFYLDFEDLNKIIVNNWDVFKHYFPDQNWIATKIKEMADCRHLVAHNSFIDDHGRDVIKVNYKSILRQLDSVLS